MREIDCRAMACPLPVVTVKRSLEESQGVPLRVLLDDGPPRENVARFAVNRGFRIVEQPLPEGGYALEISGPTLPATFEEPGAHAPPQGPAVLLIGSDCLGDGPEDLGRLLMKNFLITLLDLAEPPDRIFFVNTGVLLAVAGSEVVDVLHKLGNAGVEVFSCGICLDFFQRREQLAAGAVTNMFTIAETLLAARSVVRL